MCINSVFDEGFTLQIILTDVYGIEAYKWWTFQVHHIDYDKKNNDVDNLVTLCTPCHTKTNFNRDEWKKTFSGDDKMIEEIVLYLAHPFRF